MYRVSNGISCPNLFKLLILFKTLACQNDFGGGVGGGGGGRGGAGRGRGGAGRGFLNL